MMCGPVLIQLLLGAGFAAYGSVLLASVPPASMYMRPTLPAAGGLRATHAPTHSKEFLSMHMGSGPGVAGLSGMQVNPFAPLRRVRIFPSASMATMVAPFETLAGAADIALAIIFLSAAASFFASAANAFAVNASDETIITIPRAMLF